MKGLAIGCIVVQRAYLWGKSSIEMELDEKHITIYTFIVTSWNLHITIA